MRCNLSNTGMGSIAWEIVQIGMVSF
jgi:hypothetical protein